MNKQTIKKETIQMAATLARGDALQPLLTRCEQQNKLSAQTVERELEAIHEAMKEYAIQMRKLHDLV